MWIALVLLFMIVLLIATVITDDVRASIIGCFPLLLLLLSPVIIVVCLWMLFG